MTRREAPASCVPGHGPDQHCTDGGQEPDDPELHPLLPEIVAWAADKNRSGICVHGNAKGEQQEKEQGHVIRIGQLW
jgi:hypothetical protein